MHKIIFRQFLAVVVLTCGAFTSAAQTTTNLYNYSRLALKDLDEMNQLVQEKITESRAAQGDKVTILRDAMQAIFARPNDDFMIDKIMSPLRNELDEHGAWESTIKSLVEESIQALNKPDKVKPAAQVTYAVMLENFLGEMKPRIHEKFENSMITLIQDADISLTKKAQNERKLGMMRPTKSPSEIAKEMLKAARKTKK